MSIMVDKARHGRQSPTAVRDAAPPGAVPVAL
jgi:hypothetical protein